MRRNASALWIALALPIAGCAGAPARSPEPAVGVMDRVPLLGPGMTSASSTQAGAGLDPPATTGVSADDQDIVLDVDDVDGGATITFRTTKKKVETLRAWVRRMADLHVQRFGGPLVAAGGMRAGGSFACTGGGLPVPPSLATADPIYGGARLTLLALEPSQAALLRLQVRERADAMRRGRCPMNE
jgi:hypothetical protein